MDFIFNGFQQSKYEPYNESETIVDRMMHRSTILKVIYTDRFQKFILVEKVQTGENAGICVLSLEPAAATVNNGKKDAVEREASKQMAQRAVL